MPTYCGNLVLITPPAQLITLAEAKMHLRVDHNDEDGLIENLIEAAVQHMDGRNGMLGRAILPQTWEYVADAFPTCDIWLPLGPLRSVTSVIYDDVDGVEQTIPDTDYIVDTVSDPGRVSSLTSVWPTPRDQLNSVRVRFVAGIAASAAAAPRPLKQAALLLVGAWYANRENVTSVALKDLPRSIAAESLMGYYRRLSV